MAEIFGKLKRGGEEVDQNSAKTDGLCKGGTTGVGSAPSLSEFTKYF